MGQAISTPDLSGYATQEEINKLRRELNDLSDEIPKIPEIPEIPQKAVYSESNNTNDNTFVTPLYWGTRYDASKYTSTDTDDNNVKFVTPKFVSDKKSSWTVSAANDTEKASTADDKFATAKWTSDKINKHKTEWTVSAADDSTTASNDNHKFSTTSWVNKKINNTTVDTTNDVDIASTADNKFPTAAWTAAKINKEKANWTASTATNSDPTLTSNDNNKFPTTSWVTNKINNAKDTWTVSFSDDTNAESTVDNKFTTPAWVNRKLNNLIPTGDASDTASNEKFVTPKYLTDDRTATNSTHNTSTFRFATPSYIDNVWFTSKKAGTQDGGSTDKIATPSYVDAKVSDAMRNVQVSITSTSEATISNNLANNSNFIGRIGSNLQANATLGTLLADNVTNTTRNFNVANALATSISNKLFSSATNRDLLIQHISSKLANDYAPTLTQSIVPTSTEFATQNLKIGDVTGIDNPQFEMDDNLITSGRFEKDDSELQLINPAATNSPYNDAKNSFLEIRGAARGFNRFGSTENTRNRRKVKISDDLLVNNRVAIGPNEDTVPQTETQQDDGYSLKVGGPALFKQGATTANLSVTGLSNLTGNTRISGKTAIGTEVDANYDLKVQGQAQFGNTTIGNLRVDNVQSSTGNFATFSATSGNFNLLNVQADTTITGNLSAITGNTVLGNTTITGNLSATTGNTVLGNTTTGNLNAGNSTLGNTRITGNLNLTGDLQISGSGYLTDFDAFSNGDSATFSAGWTTNASADYDSIIRGTGRAGIAYNSEQNDDDASSKTATYTVPENMKTGYLIHMQWPNGRYFDIYGMRGSTEIFIRRVNAFQGIKESENAEGSNKYIDGINVVAIPGVNRFASIRIKGRKGRIHLLGVGWSKSNLGMAGENGFVHYDNLYGPALISSLTNHEIKTTSGHDWLRIYGSTANGVALYNGLSLNDNGGINVGEWTRVPTGTIKTQKLQAISGDGHMVNIFKNATGGNLPAMMVRQTNDHSWGTVAEFRTERGGDNGDRPSIIFSHAENDSTWSVGFGAKDDNFRIKQDHGHRNPNSNHGWGSERMRIDRGGRVKFFGEINPEDTGHEFKHSNDTEGIGLGHNTIYATGTNANQDLGLKARGTGKVKVKSNMDVYGNLTVSGSGYLSDFDTFSNGDSATFSVGWTTNASADYDSIIRGTGRAGHAYNSEVNDEDASSKTVTYTVPGNMKTGYLIHVPWSNTRYFDIYGIRPNNTDVFIRRVNAYQNVRHDTRDSSFRDGVNVVAIPGVNRFASIRIQGRKGRMHLMGIGWSKSNLGMGGENGFVHGENIYGTIVNLGNGWTTDTSDTHLRFKYNGNQKMVIHNNGTFWAENGGWLHDKWGAHNHKVHNPRWEEASTWN